MKKYYLTTILVFASACTSLSKKTSKAEFMYGSNSLNASAKTIETELSRGANQYGYYAVEAYPFTRPLIEALAREESKMALDDQKQLEKRLSDKLQTFGTKNCFMFTVGTHALETSKFSNYVAKLEANGKFYPLIFQNAHGITSIPSPTEFYGYKWYNNSVACTFEKTVVAPFKVHFSSVLMPNAKPTTLEW